VHLTAFWVNKIQAVVPPLFLEHQGDPKTKTRGPPGAHQNNPPWIKKTADVGRIQNISSNPDKSIKSLCPRAGTGMDITIV
jgi:hypothetical protein